MKGSEILKEKENQRMKLTKMLLKNSLIDLMHSKSINKITIKELCDNAGINRSTFYLHYCDQYALLDEIETEILLQARKHLEKIDSNLSSIHYLMELLTYTRDNDDILKTLLCCQENLPFQKTLIDILINYLKSKLTLNCSEDISDYVFCYLTMGCLSIIKRWIESDFDMTIEDLADMIYQMSDKAVSVYS